MGNRLDHQFLFNEQPIEYTVLRKHSYNLIFPHKKHPHPNFLETKCIFTVPRAIQRYVATNPQRHRKLEKHVKVIIYDGHPHDNEQNIRTIDDSQSKKNKARKWASISPSFYLHPHMSKYMERQVSDAIHADILVINY